MSARAWPLANALAPWFRAAGLKRILQVGYADGAFLQAMAFEGFAMRGIELPATETDWLVPFDATGIEIEEKDFFDLASEDVRDVDVLVTDAVFETLGSWRANGGATIAKYRDGRGAPLLELLPQQLKRLGVPAVLIEPDYAEFYIALGKPRMLCDVRLSRLSRAAGQACALYLVNALQYLEDTGRDAGVFY